MKKFELKQNADDNDDLQHALQNNFPSKFSLKDITHIVAEVCGENDEYAWWWILKMKNRKFFLLSGGCDYTGWDCQSSITEYGYFDTPLNAALASPVKEKYSERNIQRNLIAQIERKQPLFTYKEYD